MRAFYLTCTSTGRDETRAGIRKMAISASVDLSALYDTQVARLICFPICCSGGYELIILIT